LGDGAAGTINFTNAELDRIIDGWGNLVFGDTATDGALNVRAYNWRDSVDLRSQSGVITIAGDQTVTGNMIIRTDGNPVINGNLSGTGNLYFMPSSVATIGMNIATG